MLIGIYNRERERFEANPKEAQELLAVGEYRVDPGLSTTSTAALAMVASTMLNMDEAYMKR